MTAITLMIGSTSGDGAVQAMVPVARVPTTATAAASNLGPFHSLLRTGGFGEWSLIGTNTSRSRHIVVGLTKSAFVAGFKTEPNCAKSQFARAHSFLDSLVHLKLRNDQEFLKSGGASAFCEGGA
jgi:hypothetical protein